MRVIARLTLDRVVDNVFAETEQVAFCTQNVVPGIDFSDDPLLQGRNFSYLDTQLKRLGSTNFTQIPVNAPRCPVAHFQRDGHMQMSPAGGARPTTSPTRSAAPTAARAPTSSTATRACRARRPDRCAGCGRRPSPTTTARRASSGSARPTSSSSTSWRRTASSSASARSRPSAPGCSATSATSTRTSRRAVADELGMPLPEASQAAVPTRTDLPESRRAQHPAQRARLLRRPQARRAGHRTAPTARWSRRSRTAFTGAGALVEYVAPAAGPLKLKGGRKLTPDHAVVGAPSVLFDAVAVRAVRGRGAGARGAQDGPRLRRRRVRPPEVRRAGRADAQALLDAAGVTPGRRVPGADGGVGGRLPRAVRGAAPLGAPGPGLTTRTAVHPGR